MEFLKRLYPILLRIDECFKSNNDMAFLHNKFREIQEFFQEMYR